MRAARMHGYKQPLRLEEVPIPEIGPEDVLVKVGAAGMCRTDYQLIDGYFRSALDLEFPATPGHEIAGWIERIGRGVSKDFGLTEGALVVVDGAWGDERCRQCRRGNQQLCRHGHWAGFGPYGGYAEYVPVPAKHVLRVHSKALTPELLAPLTDAGVTPYRGIKKLVAAGALRPNRTLAVFGVGGLGAYAIQYAKLLGAGSTVVALARTDSKLELAKRHGADHVINTRDRSLESVRDELVRLTGRPELDAVIDCVGAKGTLQLGFGLLTTEGAYCSVGLVGDRIEIPLFPFVAREYSYFGSFWGNFSDLSEVLELAERGEVKHAVERVAFTDVNDALSRLGKGEVVGRAVIVYD